MTTTVPTGWRRFADGPQWPPHQSLEGVLDCQGLDPLPGLKVLGLEPRAARMEGCGDDQRILKAEAVAPLYIERPGVEGHAWIDPPQRKQHALQEAPRIACTGRRGDLSGDDIERLLYDLEADSSLAVS